MLDVAVHAFDALQSLDAQAAAPTLAALVGAAAEAHDAPLALRALAALSARRGAPTLLDEGTLVAALGAAARTRSRELEEAAWAALEATAAARGAPPSDAAYAALMASRAARGELEGAFRALAQLQRAHTERELPPGALAPLVAACSGGADALDAAYYTVERLHGRGETVGATALNVVIAACARAGDVGRAFETFEEIERTFAMAPTTASYNALLGACVWHGRAWAAPRLADEMAAKGVEPDATTRALLLDGALAARDLPAALVQLQAAVAIGEAPPRDTLRRLLMQTKRVGDDAALATVEAAMEALGVGHVRPAYAPRAAA